MHGLVWSLAKCLYDQATVITRQVYLQVKKAGKDAWVSLSTALAQIRKEAAGDFSSSFDNAKESVRASHAPADDQPGRGRGRGSERGGARAGRPARRRDGDDLLPVLPEVSHTYLKAATCKCMCLQLHTLTQMRIMSVTTKGYTCWCKSPIGGCVGDDCFCGEALQALHN